MERMSDFMRGRNRSRILIALLAGLTLAGGGAILLASGAAARVEPEITLRAADDHERSYPTTQGLIRMGEIIEERTNGRIVMQVYPLAQLGSETETIRKTQLGQIDINRVNVNPITDIEPVLKVFSLPYLFASTEHLHRVVDGPIGQDLLMQLEEHGLIGLAYYDSGQRSFYTSIGPIRSPQDLAGMKIRVQKADIMSDLVRAFDAQPVQLAFEDVYTGLQTGVIDGAENNYPSWVTKGHYETARYYAADAHVRTPEVILMSKMTWDALAPADQEIVREAALESVSYQRRLWREKQAEARRTAEESGAQIVEDVRIDRFRAASQEVYDEHATGLIEEYARRIHDAERE